MGLLRRRRDRQVIDLRDLGEGRPSSPFWGSPLPCPECSGRGYLDHIDPFKEIMFLHCTRCELKYEIRKADLDAAVA